MRSDRYKDSNISTGMNAEDRKDFWSGASIEQHAGDVPKKSGGAGSFIKNLLIDVVVAVVLAGIVLFFVRPTIVKQSSMEDTLHENDYMIMYRQAYRNSTPERGDIIIFQSDLTDEETGKDKLLIKRVIGLPGDDIKIADGQLYINGEAYKEDYLKDGFTPAFEIPPEGETYTVPEGMFFCMGDNRAGSTDSRDSRVGCVPADAIEGKVIVRLFPFNQIRTF